MDAFETIDDQFARYARQLVDDPAARFSALRKCSFFLPVPDDWLQRIAQMARIKAFSPDTCITTQDEETKGFHVILYGTAEAYRNGKLVGTIETGDCFGEGVFLTDGTATTSATVIAEDRLVAAEFDKAAIDALRSDPAAMVSMDKALLLALYKKLKGANQKIERLMLS